MLQEGWTPLQQLVIINVDGVNCDNDDQKDHDGDIVTMKIIRMG